MNLVSGVDRGESNMAFPQGLADFFVWAPMREILAAQLSAERYQQRIHRKGSLALGQHHDRIEIELGNLIAQIIG